MMKVGIVHYAIQCVLQLIGRRVHEIVLICKYRHKITKRTHHDSLTKPTFSTPPPPQYHMLFQTSFSIRPRASGVRATEIQWRVQPMARLFEEILMERDCCSLGGGWQWLGRGA
jgi:hypothetical protein